MSNKLIWFDEVSGDLFLFDETNNPFKCNIYGDKLPTFLPDISGSSSFKERKEFMNKQDFSKIVPKNRLDDNLYRPNMRKLEGYFQFPRPLSKPFFNEKLPRHEDTGNFINSLKDTLKIEKNKEIFNKTENMGLNYQTSSLTVPDKTSKLKLIKIIDEYIEKFKLQNKYKLDLVKKDPKIKALKRAKKILLSNDGDRLINGREVPQPDEKVLKRIYDIKNKNKIMRKKSYDPHINTDSKEKDDLSFMSEESTDNQPTRFKSKDELLSNYDREKKFLKGFQPPIIKEKGIIIKEFPKSLKSPGQLYVENLNLLKKVNPIAFELEEKKMDFDRKVMEKRRQQKLVNQKNIGFEIK